MQQVETDGADIVQYRSLNDQPPPPLFSTVPQYNHTSNSKFREIDPKAPKRKLWEIDLTQVHPPTALWKLSRAFGEGLGFRALCFL